MFKKLREKVESAEMPEKDGLSPTGKGRQRVGGLHKMDGTSLSEADILSGRISTEDLIASLMQRTTRVKKLELKLGEYTQALKESSREKDKLSLLLEKQQDSAMKHMSELEATYSEGKEKMEKRISKLEKKEVNLGETIETLRAEKQKLQQSVDLWESEKKDFERKRDQFFAKRDNSEELNDLQMQEMAKLKHMLMMREKDCEKYRDELDQKVAELLQCQDANEELESSLRLARNSSSSSEKKLENVVKENETMSRDILSFMAEKEQLNQKIGSLTSDSQQTRVNLSALESSYSDICEKYESLKHSSEAVINKATAELGEKQGTVDHLSGKISLLEKRATTDNLPENEQVQALIAERTSLENRLEESHLQLSNIKSTWSININKLEKQVSHLNAKIAEDQDELSVKDEKIAQLCSSSAKTCEESEYLQKKLDEVKQQLDESLRENENFSLQIGKIEAEMIEQSLKHDLERSKLTTSLVELTAADQEKERKLEEKIGRLEKCVDESRNRTTALEKEIASLKCSCEEKNEALKDVQKSRDTLQKDYNEMRDLRMQIENKLKSTEVDLTSSVEELRDMTNRFENAAKDLSEKAGRLQEAESLLELSSSQLKIVKQQLEEKEKELSDCKAKNEVEISPMVMELREKITVLDLSLQSREEELMNCKAEIALLRNVHTEHSGEVTVLKAERIKFTDQLAERDRNIKVQQQRLNDLKKALSKELNKKSVTFSRPDNRTPSPRHGAEMNGYGSLLQLNNSEDSGTEEAVVSDGDPNFTTINAKYLKHVILTFLGGSQSEAQQLVKAMSMLLRFNKDEEKFVKEILEYRSSWFGSKPSAKAVQSRLKSRKR